MFKKYSPWSNIRAMTAILGFRISRRNEETSKQYLLPEALVQAPAQRLSQVTLSYKTKGQSGLVLSWESGNIWFTLTPA